MAQSDKEKWNKKYQETPQLLHQKQPSKRLESILPFINATCALDVACGAGRHSIYLASNGFNVDAVDISQIALDRLSAHNIPNISTYLLDLDHWKHNDKKYDLIVMSNFLDRDLISKLQYSLNTEGVFFIETYMNHPSNTKPNSNPLYLLNPQELKSFFDKEFEILEYGEVDNESYERYRMKKQYIAVRKIV